jgi:hypothetical protein
VEIPLSLPAPPLGERGQREHNQQYRPWEVEHVEEGENAEARSGVGVGLLLLVAIDDLDGSRRGAYQFEIAHHQKMNQVAPVSVTHENTLLASSGTKHANRQITLVLYFY